MEHEGNLVLLIFGLVVLGRGRSWRYDDYRVLHADVASANRRSSPTSLGR